MTNNLTNFPTLNQPMTSGTVSWKFVLNSQFEESLVSNISIVPTVMDQYVMMKLSNGDWELAGGTLEPDEAYLECLRREVMEELGAELIHYRIFGHFDCFNHAKEPYRPHLPFPHFVRVMGTGEVNIVTKPLNPEGGEEVVAVEVVDIEEAVKRFKEMGRSDLAELYWLAHQIRNSVEE
ncbi:NUDIX hydrolase [Paenibacillus hodogayensis]|uniref:NUDIX hydrolase n=1 Tax=Paenibacillus hodogayensis TaxID=279208 RepID=A0ABV5W6U2_9BACL